MISPLKKTILKHIIDTKRFNIKQKTNLIEMIILTDDTSLKNLLKKKLQEKKYTPKELRHPLSKAINTYAGGVNAAGGAVIAHAFLASKTNPKLYAAILIGGIALSVILGSLINRIHKECNGLKNDKVKFYKCRVKADNLILNKLKVLEGKCKTTDNPTKCTRQIQVSIVAWENQLKKDERFLKALTGKNDDNYE